MKNISLSIIYLFVSLVAVDFAKAETFQETVNKIKELKDDAVATISSIQDKTKDAADLLFNKKAELMKLKRSYEKNPSPENYLTLVNTNDSLKPLENNYNSLKTELSEEKIKQTEKLKTLESTVDKNFRNEMVEYIRDAERVINQQTYRERHDPAGFYDAFKSVEKLIAAGAPKTESKDSDALYEDALAKKKAFEDEKKLSEEATIILNTAVTEADTAKKALAEAQDAFDKDNTEDNYKKLTDAATAETTAITKATGLEQSTKDAIAKTNTASQTYTTALNKFTSQPNVDQKKVTEVTVSTKLTPVSKIPEASERDFSTFNGNSNQINQQQQQAQAPPISDGGFGGGGGAGSSTATSFGSGGGGDDRNSGSTNTVTEKPAKDIVGPDETLYKDALAKKKAFEDEKKLSEETTTKLNTAITEADAAKKAKTDAQDAFDKNKTEDNYKKLTDAATAETTAITKATGLEQSTKDAIAKTTTASQTYTTALNKFTSQPNVDQKKVTEVTVSTSLTPVSKTPEASAPVVKWDFLYEETLAKKKAFEDEKKLSEEATTKLNTAVTEADAAKKAKADAQDAFDKDKTEDNYKKLTDAATAETTAITKATGLEQSTKDAIAKTTTASQNYTTALNKFTSQPNVDQKKVTEVTVSTNLTPVSKTPEASATVAAWTKPEVVVKKEEPTEGDSDDPVLAMGLVVAEVVERRNSTGNTISIQDKLRENAFLASVKERSGLKTIMKDAEILLKSADIAAEAASRDRIAAEKDAAENPNDKSKSDLVADLKAKETSAYVDLKSKYESFNSKLNAFNQNTDDILNNQKSVREYQNQYSWFEIRETKYQKPLENFDTIIANNPESLTYRSTVAARTMPAYAEIKKVTPETGLVLTTLDTTPDTKKIITGQLTGTLPTGGTIIVQKPNTSTTTVPEAVKTIIENNNSATLRITITKDAP